MLVTLSGMVKLVICVKFVKAYDGIEVIPSGTIISPLSCSPFRYIALSSEIKEDIPPKDITLSHASKSPLKSMRVTLLTLG